MLDPVVIAFVCSVVAVPDGDTVHCYRDQRRVYKVRLNGVDAPEVPRYSTRGRLLKEGEAGGVEAKQFMTDLVRGKVLSCVYEDSDQNGRIVAICRLDGKDIGATVIAAGFARDCPAFSGGRYAKLEPPEAKNLVSHTYCQD